MGSRLAARQPFHFVLHWLTFPYTGCGSLSVEWVSSDQSEQSSPLRIRFSLKQPLPSKARRAAERAGGRRDASTSSSGWDGGGRRPLTTACHFISPHLPALADVTSLIPVPLH